MNILAYVHLRRLENATGVGRVIEQLVRRLSVSDTVEILAQREDVATVVPELDQLWQSLPYHSFPQSISKRQLQWLLPGAKTAESWWQEVDIVFSPSEAFVPTRRARSMVTIHDLAYFERGAHSENWNTKLQRMKWQWLHDVIARRVDLIHTVSQFSAGRLAHFFPAMASRIRVTHNGISDFFFESDVAPSPLLALSNSDRRPFVLVPGGLSFRKNAELILAAWSILSSAEPHLQLFVTGTCDERYALRATAMPSVKLLGFVDDAFLKTLYHQAEVVWFPSRYEGFGIPVIEAMASGSPVVTSNASSLPEIGGEAVLYADIDDPAGHVEAIDGLLRDASLRRDLVAKGHARAAHFTWDAAAASLRGHMLGLL